MLKLNRKKWLTGCMAVALALAPILSVPGEAFAATFVASAKVAEVSPTMQRLAGSDRYETAARMAQEGWKNSTNYAVLTAGMDENLVDALAAAPLAKLYNAPILLTGGNVLNPQAEAEITRLKVSTVYVTTGSVVLQKAVMDRLAELGVNTIMLGGSDRFATAVNIAKEIAKVKPFTQMAVTTAWTNADALSVASFAAAKGFPILLSDVNSIPQETADYINSIKDSISDTYVLGLEGVISKSVENVLPAPIRVGGSDRYATNREILKTFASNIAHGKIYVASGEDSHLVDALTASPLAGQALAPVVLTGRTMPVETMTYVKTNLLANQIIALGGETVVPSQSLEAMTTLLTYAENDLTKGSTDAAAPEALADTLKISGNNVTLQNVKVPYSIYVQGDKVSLKNVDVTGTIFLDPGPTGTSNFDNVNAGRIVVLSGDKNSHHFKNTKASELKIDSESRIETSGATNIARTSVSAAAILDNVAGSFGKVEVNQGIKGTDANKTIEFRGVFDQPIVVKDQAIIKAATNASIAKVEVATQYKDDIVTLQGKYNAVEVNKEGNLQVAANASISAQIKVNAQANINADPTSSVAKVEINTTQKDASVKVEGTSISIVNVKSEARVVFPDGTKVKVVIESSGVTVDSGKNAQVTVDSKTYTVQKTGEGKSIEADLSKIVSSIETAIAANNKILQSEMTMVAATRVAAQDKLIAEVATMTAKTETEKAAAVALTAKAATSAQTATTVAAQATAEIQKATQEVAAAVKQVVDAVKQVDTETGTVTPPGPVTPPVSGGGGSSGGSSTVAVSGVTLNKGTTTILVGGSETLTYTVAPTNATNQAVTWSTSDSTVATVNNGVVSGVKAGTATITVTSNADNAKKAQCTVTVSAATSINYITGDQGVTGNVTRTGSSVTISGTATTLSEVSIKVIRPDNTIMYVDVVGVDNNDTFTSSFSMPSGTSGPLTVVVGQGTTIGTGTF